MCADRLPRVVAIGGGHGLSALLRGLKTRVGDLTAVVTVADDGGSSGTLREELGLLPPGDLRNCIVALAEAEPLMTQLFQYRFGRGTGLGGHAFGNLFIAAMAGITGNFESAIVQASRVLAVRGRILPATLQDARLCAEIVHADGTTDLIYGQAELGRAGNRVERVYLQPSHVRGNPEAIRALLQADLVTLGPGSLYTSVLPNLLVKDIAAAVRVSPAVKVFVCNVATQPGETGGYSASDHVRAVEEHVGSGLFAHVLANDNMGVRLPVQSGSALVQLDADRLRGYALTASDLVDQQYPWRHDSARLADALLRLYYACQDAG